MGLSGSREYLILWYANSEMNAQCHGDFSVNYKSEEHKEPFREISEHVLRTHREGFQSSYTINLAGNMVK